jgi:hypothetical protein
MPARGAELQRVAMIEPDSTAVTKLLQRLNNFEETVCSTRVGPIVVITL